MIKERPTSERRIMVDIATARQSYNNYGIRGIRLVSGTDNREKGLTKVSGNSALMALANSERDDTPHTQWIHMADVQPTNSGNVVVV